MEGAAITFDFHNTLARCDRWFHLEIRELASAFMAWNASQLGQAVDATRQAEADIAYRKLREAIIDHGVELPAEACVAHVLDTLNASVEPRLIAQGVEEIMREAFAEVDPVPGAIETVRELAAHGVPLGIISSAVYHPFLEWTLTEFGLRSAFANITTSASAGFYKSRPELYWHAVAALNAVPEQSVHIGDSKRFDVAGAQRAGMKTVWLQTPQRHGMEFDASPDLTVETLEGAAPRILSLLGQPAG